MDNKIAMIWGVTGQTGSYLVEFLLKKSYDVVGVKRRTSTNNTQNIAGILNHPNFTLIEGDIIDPSSVNHIISTYKPNELYNLSAQSHVHTSFSQPIYTFEVNAKGPLLILEAIRNYSLQTKFYQASTSEMWGSNYNKVEIQKDEKEEAGHCLYNYYQDETTSFAPNSPYAVAKVAAHNLVRIYRDAYGIFACAGILNNHESPRRGENFVTRKITKWIGQFVCCINKDTFPKLKLGNLDAIRDFGYAGEYVEAMWLMLQRSQADDYVIGTGVGHSIRDFLTEAFKCIDITDWTPFVEIDKSLYRPNEVQYLRCDAIKAEKILGWKAKTTFKELVAMMVQHDMQQS